MKFLSSLRASMPRLIEDLQGCIRIPSVYRDDLSGYP